MNKLKKIIFKKEYLDYKGHLGGSVGWASDFGSGHNLTDHEFKPCVRLCADSSEPGAALDSVSPSRSTPPLLVLSLSKINRNINNKVFKHELFKSLLSSNSSFLNTQEFMSSFLETSTSTMSAGLFCRQAICHSDPSHL